MIIRILTFLYNLICTIFAIFGVVFIVSFPFLLAYSIWKMGIVIKIQ